MTNPKVEIEQFNIPENVCTRGKDNWYVSTLWRAAEKLEPYDLQLAALNLDVGFASANTLALFLFQVNRMLKADLNYPIIQAPDGWIMDGYHRIAKAIIEGKTTIKAIRLPVLPEVDFTDPEN